MERLVLAVLLNPPMMLTIPPLAVLLRPPLTHF